MMFVCGILKPLNITEFGAPAQRESVQQRYAADAPPTSWCSTSWCSTSWPSSL